MADEVLDFSVLEAMFGGDQSLRNAILQEFKNSAIPYVAELDGAVGQSETEGVKSLAHKLKSSSRTIGARSLGDVCERLEWLAPDGEWSEIGELQRQLKQQLQEVIAVIDQLQGVGG